MPARKTIAIVIVTVFLYLVGANLQTGWVYLLTSFIVSQILISYVVGKINTARAVAVRVAPGRAVAGEQIEFRYRIKNAPPHYVLSEDAAGVRLSGSNSSGWLRDSRIMHRGIYRLEEIKIRSTYPGGWFAFTKKIKAPHRLVVWPETDRVQLDLALFGGQGELHAPARINRGPEYAGVRKYRPGDSIRRIHWKRSARSGAIFVRETVASGTRSYVLFLDNRCAAGFDRELFEHQVSAAATVLNYLWKKGATVTLLSFRDGRLNVSKGSYEQLMDVLAGVEPDLTNGKTNGTADEVYELSAAGALLIYIMPQYSAAHPLLEKFQDVLAVCTGNQPGCADARNIYINVEQGRRTWLL